MTMIDPRRAGTLSVLLALVMTLLATAPADAHGRRGIDLTRLVVVGDSLSAGFQNGRLVADQQVHGYAPLVARQAEVDLVLPLMGLAAGIPYRLDPSQQATDLAIPGANAGQALAARPDGVVVIDPVHDPFGTDLWTELILGLPGLFQGASRSQVEWAEALAPTAVFVWIGNMDALAAAVAGDATLLTPVEQFHAAYRELVARLAATGAALIVATIPDVSVIPYFTPAAAVAAAGGLPLEAIGPVLGIGPGDLLLPEALGLVGPILAGAVPGPLPANTILDAGEVAAIRAHTRAFNRIIAVEALARHAALVDVHGLLDCVSRGGLVVGERRLTTDFGGGLFSLDGIHPTNTGYAVVANAFIRALRLHFGARIPMVDLAAVAAEDPLVPPPAGESELRHPQCVPWLGAGR